MSVSMNYSLAMRPAFGAWSEAGRDAVRGAVMIGRIAVVLAGLALLSASFAMLVSEQARGRAVELALAAVGSIQEPVAAPEPVVVVAASPSTWSDWLASRPAGRHEPQQDNVTRYLSRRYRVAEGAVRQIVGVAFSTGRSLGLDPLLILAVTAIESSLNPFAQSTMGAQGLMQVMTNMHSEKFVSHGGDHAALDPIANLKVGSSILKDLISRGGSVERGLQLYVGAGNLPDDNGYAAKVLAEMARIKVAATGNVQMALSSAWRAEPRLETKSESPALMPTSAVVPHRAGETAPFVHAAI